MISTFTIQKGELLLPHRRLKIQEITMEVLVEENEPSQLVDRLLDSPIQIQGNFKIECPASSNPLRLGMQGVLKVTAPNGQYCLLPILIIQMLNIQTTVAKQRCYQWEFFVIARPSNDPLGLMPDSEAAMDGELSIDGLLQQLGADSQTQKLAKAHFTTEGGFYYAEES